jgi:hypothetical protein
MEFRLSRESDLGYQCDCGSGSHGGWKNTLMRFGTGFAHLPGDRFKYEFNSCRSRG